MVEHELCVLATLMQKNIKPSELGIGPEDFTEKSRADVFRMCQLLEAQDTPIDLITLDTVFEEQAARSTDKEGNITLSRSVDTNFLIDLQGSGAGFSGAIALQAARKMKEATDQRRIFSCSADFANTMRPGSPADIDAQLDAHIEQLQAIRKARDTDEQRTPAQPDSARAYIQSRMKGEILEFMKNGKRRTGFANLDKAIGGIYPGVYLLGAISSLGKTTFAHQIADQMAKDGEHVLFFSCEMTRLEMVSKSIARTTAQRDKSTAATALSIRCGHLPAHVLDAADAYSEAVEDRMNVVEGSFDFSVLEIAEYIRRYIRRNNVRPVCFIDYMQVLSGDPAKRLPLREQIDDVAKILEKVAKTNGVPMFVISSVNRQNYMQEFSFESLKESGGLEYTADCVLGMQLQCLDEDLFNSEKDVQNKRKRIKEAKAEIPRKIKLVCLKNRTGSPSFDCYFKYYPQYDLFEPMEEPKTQTRKGIR